MLDSYVENTRTMHLSITNWAWVTKVVVTGKWSQGSVLKQLDSGQLLDADYESDSEEKGGGELHAYLGTSVLDPAKLLAVISLEVAGY